jgi:hypothetical protein
MDESPDIRPPTGIIRRTGNKSIKIPEVVEEEIPGPELSDPEILNQQQVPTAKTQRPELNKQDLCGLRKRDQIEYLHPYRGLPSWSMLMPSVQECLLPILIIILLSFILIANAAESIGGKDLTRFFATFSMSADMRIPPEEKALQIPLTKTRIEEGRPFQCYGFTLDESSRYLTGPELNAVYVAIDALREHDEFRAIGDTVMANSHKIRVAPMDLHVRGSTSFFTQGGFTLNENLVARVAAVPDSPVAVAELAGTLVHEYVHTEQLGAEFGPLRQALYQITYGIAYSVSLLMEWSGVGLRDQNGQAHSLFEILPWQQGTEAENLVLYSLQNVALEKSIERRQSRISNAPQVLLTGGV